MKQHLNTLYLNQDGLWLALDGETISISKEGKTLGRFPLHNLEAICSFGWDNCATPQLMGKCATDGIAISFCNPNGKLLCRVSAYGGGNVLLRKDQYQLSDHLESRIRISREMVAAKILNARTNLQRAVRDRAELKPALERIIGELAYCAQSARSENDEEKLRGIEGHAAETYYRAWGHLLSNPDFQFSGRNKRPPKDEVNALLSFAYTLLAHDCRSALEACGLDAAVGVFHRLRPGRASLALDLMEEFRAPLADRLALTLINRKQLCPKDFKKDAGGACMMSDDARKVLLTHWQERKKESIKHPYLGETVTIGMLPHIQARLMAQRIRGAIDAYPPILWK